MSALRWYVQSYGPQHGAELIVGPVDRSESGAVRVCVRRAPTTLDEARSLAAEMPAETLRALHDAAEARFEREFSPAANASRAKGQWEAEPLRQWPEVSL